MTLTAEEKTLKSHSYTNVVRNLPHCRVKSVVNSVVNSVEVFNGNEYAQKMYKPPESSGKRHYTISPRTYQVVRARANSSM